MVCKFCNAQIDDELEICPECGKSLIQEQEEEVEIEIEILDEDEEQTPETEEEADEEETDEEDSDEDEEDDEDNEDDYKGFSFSEVQRVAPKKSRGKLALEIIASVLAMGALVVLLLMAMGVKITLPKNNIFRKTSYTVSDDVAVKHADKVVATMGGRKLTNTQLQIYYRMELLDFVNNYSAYLSYIGFDYTQPLSQQTCYFDETMSWEQYFIERALLTWQNYQGLCLSAEAVGFTIDEELAAELAAIPESLETQAAEGEFENADAMVKNSLGPSCTVDSYMAYVHLNALGSEYYSSEYAKIEVTDEAMDAYFQEHADEYAQQGITQEGLVSSVRHILIAPKGGTLNDDGSTTYSDEEWDAAKAEAERILQLWKDGDATEESFIALVPEYTEDPGSATTGGLYQDINPTSS